MAPETLSTDQRITALDAAHPDAITDAAIVADTIDGDPAQPRVWLTIIHADYGTLTTAGADEAEAFAKMHDLLTARRTAAGA